MCVYHYQTGNVLNDAFFSNQYHIRKNCVYLHSAIGVVCYETRLGVINGSDHNKREQQFVDAARRMFDNLHKSMVTDYICKKMGIKNKYEGELFADFDESWK